MLLRRPRRAELTPPSTTAPDRDDGQEQPRRRLAARVQGGLPTEDRRGSIVGIDVAKRPDAAVGLVERPGKLAQLAGELVSLPRMVRVRW